MSGRLTTLRPEATLKVHAGRLVRQGTSGTVECADCRTAHGQPFLFTAANCLCSIVVTFSRRIHNRSSAFARRIRESNSSGEIEASSVMCSLNACLSASNTRAVRVMPPHSRRRLYRPSLMRQPKHTRKTQRLSQFLCSGCIGRVDLPENTSRFRAEQGGALFRFQPVRISRHPVWYRTLSGCVHPLRM